MIDSKFIFLCLKCNANKRGSKVNHEYTTFPWGLRIKYHCFECGEEETKDIEIGIDSTPKTKEEFVENSVPVIKIIKE